MLTDAHKRAISRSWHLLAPIQETAADLFYKRLFAVAPQYRALFQNDLASQKQKFLTMLAFVVRSLEWKDEDWREPVQVEEDLFLVILALGRRHTALYGVPDDAYDTVGEALLWTLDYGLGDAFTAETKEAWQLAYQLLAATMKMGRAAIEGGAPLPDPYRSPLEAVS